MHFRGRHGGGHRPKGFSLTTADVDNDSDLDLLVADFFGNAIKVQLNTGGTFGPATDVSVTGPRVVTTGDVDGDGDLDIVTTSGNSGSVRFNNGSGVFSGGGSANLPGSLGLALGDLDGDGDLDAVTASGANAYVRFNNGSGVFGGGYTANVGVVPADASANGVMLGDLDGDGDLDMAINDDGEELTTIYLNDGTGQLNETLNVPAGDGYEAAMGDLDGDGDLDIVVANSGGASSTVLLNNGDATFAAGTPAPTTTPFGITLGDVDNDGDLDILNTNDDASAVQVLLNDNAFTVTARAPERHTATSPVFADVNLTLSEAINPLTANQLRVFGAQSSGRKGGIFAGVGTSLSLTPNVAFAPGELVSVSARATIKTVGNVKTLRPHVYQFRAAATGGSGAFANAPDAAVAPGPADAKLADVDGDGDLDLVTLDINFDQVSVQLNAGAGTYAPATATATGNAPQAMALADVDADGDLDLLVTGTAPNLLSVRFNAGGTFGGGTDVAVADFAVALAVGDIDGDGDLDFVTANKASNTSSVRRNNGAGTFAAAGTVAVGTLPQAVALSDIDNDGDLDLLTANETAGTVSLRRNDGTGTFSGAEEITVGATPQALAVADIDGDGDADFLTANGESQTISVRRNTGAGAFGAGSTLGFGAEVRDVTLADVDGDGFLDLLAVLTDANAVRVGLNNGGGSFSLTAPVPVGAGPNTVASGDVDGDGDVDFVTADIQAATISVRLNGAAAGPAPLIASFTPDHGVTGTVVTLTGTNFLGTTAVTFDGVAAPGFVVNGGGTEITVSSPPATFNGVIAVTTPDGVASTATDFGVDLVVSAVESIPFGDFHHITVTNTGAATLGGAVEATADVLVQTGGELADGGNVLSGIGTFTLEPGATLRLRHPQGLNPTGALQLSGGLTLDAGADYVYKAALAQVTGTNLPLEVRNLTIDNAAGVSLTQATSVRRILTMAGAGDFNLSGQALTLLSNAAGTALVVNAGAGKVVGDATAQVWLSNAPNPGLGSRHLSSPTKTSTVADLATVGFVPVVNNAYNNAVNPLLVKPYPNVFGFDETRYPASADFTKAYYSPAAPNTVLGGGVGYSVFIGGGLTPDFTGELSQGDVTRAGLTRTGNFSAPGEKSGWHLLGNPYPSPIDWDLVTVPAGMDPAIFVFQSTGKTTGTYLARANGMGTLPSGVIPMGQAFFALVTTAPVDFTFTNACRVTTYGSPAHYRAADPRPAVHLSLRATGASPAETDGAAVYFQEGATPAVDRGFDAQRPARNPGLPTLASLTATGAELAVNGLPEAALTNHTVELLLDLPAAGTYELAVARAANLTGVDATLLDRLTGTRYDLRATPVVAVTATAAGEVRGRFALVFGSAATATGTSSLSLYPNPTRGAARLIGALPGATVTVFDATGRRVLTTTADATGAATLTSSKLTAGVYVVRSGAQTQRLVVE